MKIDIYNKQGKKTSKKVTLNDDVFKIEPNDHCIYLAVQSEMAALRQGTHSSKTRSEVRGGGAKPYKQKGTGRARVGSTRNPARVAGGSAFGPKPRKYSKSVNRKVKQLARKSVLSQKILSKDLIVVDNFDLESNKTKDFMNVLTNLDVVGKKNSIMLGDVSDNVHFSSRNIKGTIVFSALSASTYDLLDCQKLIFDLDGIEKLNSQLSEK
ncbi:MAG: 50S ribosomal protein L4 [Candidatus Marinimicrobia bacterium]|nr:50S ribosomal protein L4 [Candidatus Neomarinimicrobiota bacterium]